MPTLAQVQHVCNVTDNYDLSAFAKCTSSLGRVESVFNITVTVPSEWFDNDATDENEVSLEGSKLTSTRARGCPLKPRECQKESFVPSLSHYNIAAYSMTLIVFIFLAFFLESVTRWITRVCDGKNSPYIRKGWESLKGELMILGLVSMLLSVVGQSRHSSSFLVDVSCCECACSYDR